MVYNLQDWWWLWGKPAEFFTLFEGTIERYIRTLGKNEVVVIPEVNVAAIMPEMNAPTIGGTISSPAMAKSSARKPIWWYGGMRSPHIHYKDQVYLLTQKQWDVFMKESILPEFQERLTKVKSISFTETMNLISATPIQLP
jgi:hypothetical protein